VTRRIRDFTTVLGILIALALMASPGCSTSENDRRSSGGTNGPYLGETPPGLTPRVFAPGLVSTGADELNSIFSPDGTEFVFSIKTPDRSHHTVLGMNRRDESWTPPRVLSFSGRFSDADPAYGPGGDSLYFISRRPISKGDAAKEDWDIWVVERSEDGWGEPTHLDEPVNTDKLEVYPSLTRDGVLYFSSGRDGGQGQNDLYRTSIVDGHYTEPENLGDAINSEHSEGDLFIAPDESYIIFVSSRPEGHGRGDLYVSFRQEDGSWTRARNMGEGINSPWLEYCPAVTPDGKYLFFTSYRHRRGDLPSTPLTYEKIVLAYDRPQGGLGDIYWVDAAIIEQLRD